MRGSKARVERPPEIPLPHQNEALDNILSTLREHDRATALMACGTGKTLVALWVAEREANHSRPRTLARSPAPDLHEWAHETRASPSRISASAPTRP